MGTPLFLQETTTKKIVYMSMYSSILHVCKTLSRSLTTASRAPSVHGTSNTGALIISDGEVKRSEPVKFSTQLTQVLQTAVWTMGRGDTWGGATRVAPPTPNSIGLYGKSYWCRPEHVHSFIFDLAILHKYYVLTLELYAYLNYNLFSNNGNFSQMKSLFTNKLLMTAPPGFFIHISLRIGRP